MHSLSSVLFLSALLPFLTAAVRIKVDVPATTFLPNPAALPSTSSAVLTSKGKPLSVPISRSNTFLFADVPAGSHLLSVYSRDVLFENLRVDVSETGAVQSWQTFRGNEWNNKGEVRGSGDAGDGIAVLQVRAVAKKEYYQLRPSCKHDAIQINKRNDANLSASLCHVPFPKPNDLDCGCDTRHGDWCSLYDGE
jgi:hypothetical protein